MKTNILLLLLAMLVAFSCSEQIVTLSEDELPEDIFYLDNKVEPYSGKCRVLYSEDGSLKAELNFKEGILHGPGTTYYKNGTVKRQGIYHEGCFHGKWQGFNETGKLILEAEYVNDTLSGKFYTWYATGVMKERGSYENNLRVGEWITYDEAGMILSKSVL